MLSDEEKKAIEVIKGLAVYYNDYSLLDEEEIEENEEVNNSINIVINLIKKQSKEIEELKENNNETVTQIYIRCSKKFKDKIKAKIEEVDYKMVAHQDVREAVKQVLQSLLEKE